MTFDEWRNKIGALLILHKHINSSLQDAKYEQKLIKYSSSQGNLFSATLSNNAYKNNPQFLSFIEEYKLLFRSYSTFGKNEIQERNALMSQLCSLIWNTDCFN